jgi:hypothetical protein
MLFLFVGLFYFVCFEKRVGRARAARAHTLQTLFSATLSVSPWLVDLSLLSAART